MEIPFFFLLAESTRLKTLDMDDKDSEEEFRKLELEISGEIHPSRLHEPVGQDGKEASFQVFSEILTQDLSKLNLEAA